MLKFMHTSFGRAKKILTIAYLHLSCVEAATSSKKDTQRMETSLENLRKELAQEKERSKKLQDDVNGLSDKETKLNRTLTTVRLFFF